MSKSLYFISPKLWKGTILNLGEYHLISKWQKQIKEALRGEEQIFIELKFSYHIKRGWVQRGLCQITRFKFLLWFMWSVFSQEILVRKTPFSSFIFILCIHYTLFFQSILLPAVGSLETDDPIQWLSHRHQCLKGPINLLVEENSKFMGR